jgi:hypothetical protein
LFSKQASLQIATIETPLMKESIIKISKPTPKVPIQPPEDEPQPETTQNQENSLPEELPQPEQIDFAQPTSISFTNTSYSGWKVSDILREIRLDSFAIDDDDLD